MGQIQRVLSKLLGSVIGIAVMVVLATIVFYVTIFVVSTGARLAGIRPGPDFVVLSAALIVVAVILTGGLSPQIGQRTIESEAEADESDATYG